MKAPLKTYGAPAIGCYLEHSCRNVDELSRDIIALAVSFGWTLPADGQAILDAADADENELDFIEQLDDLAEEAESWLNDQETRSFLYWSNDGEAGAFGLWAHTEDAEETLKFVLSEGGPPSDYRGEWLCVSRQGDAERLYIRESTEYGCFDTEIWSVV